MENVKFLSKYLSKSKDQETLKMLCRIWFFLFIIRIVDRIGSCSCFKMTYKLPDMTHTVCDIVYESYCLTNAVIFMRICAVFMHENNNKLFIQLNGALNDRLYSTWRFYWRSFKFNVRTCTTSNILENFMQDEKWIEVQEYETRSSSQC